MLLKPEEIEARIKLYADLRDAMTEFVELEAQIPHEAPPGMMLTQMAGNVSERAAFVISRAWPALRKAMLADAQKKVDECEAAVRAFEAGEEVTNEPE